MSQLVTLGLLQEEVVDGRGASRANISGHRVVCPEIGQLVVLDEVPKA